MACFAKSVAHAKTDAIDAAVIRRYAEARRPEPALPRSEAAAGLDALLALRETIVKANVALKAALGTGMGAAAGPMPYKVALSTVMRMLLCRLEGVARNYRARRKAGQSAPPSSLPLPPHPLSCPPYNPLNGKR